jgi:hypothetical protein
MANTIAAIAELSVQAWSAPDCRYMHGGPQGVGTRNVDYLIWSVAEHGAAYVPDGLTVAQERSNKLQAAAYADAKALDALGRNDPRLVDQLRTRAEQFARMLREFDAAHESWSGAMPPHDAYFDREDGAAREFVRQEWAAAVM